MVHYFKMLSLLFWHTINFICSQTWSCMHFTVHFIYKVPNFNTCNCGCKTWHNIRVWMGCFCFEAKHWKKNMNLQIKVLWFWSEKNSWNHKQALRKNTRRCETTCASIQCTVIEPVIHMVCPSLVTCALPTWNWKRNSSPINMCSCG